MAMWVRVTMLVAALLAVAGSGSTAQADPFGLISFHSYKMEHRPVVVFPPPRKRAHTRGSVHISPYPASKRGASVWESDLCWKQCTGESGWRFQYCAPEFGPEACRQALDADNRSCLRTCRIRGGPMVNLAN